MMELLRNHGLLVSIAATPVAAWLMIVVAAKRGNPWVSPWGLDAVRWHYSVKPDAAAHVRALVCLAMLVAVRLLLF